MRDPQTGSLIAKTNSGPRWSCHLVLLVIACSRFVGALRSQPPHVAIVQSCHNSEFSMSQSVPWARRFVLSGLFVLGFLLALSLPTAAQRVRPDSAMLPSANPLCD